MSFLKIFLLFWLFSVLGWILEELAFIVADRKLVNRGFLIGPYCPIYGFGALIMLIISPYKDHMFVCFILALVLCSVLEYFASYLMEKIFKIRWWDYSKEKHNLDGRICLKNLTHFGIGAIAVVELLNPLIDKYLFRVEPKLLIILSLIFLTLILIDLTVSTQAIASLKLNILKLKNKDATTVIKKGVRRNLEERGFVTKRLVKAFPNLNDLNKYFKKNYFGEFHHDIK